MSLETDLRAYLLTVTALTDLIGTRLTVGRRPQDTAEPAVVFRRISTTPQHDIGGPSGVADVRVQFDILDQDYVDCTPVADALRNALEGLGTAATRLNGTGSTLVYSCRHAGESFLPLDRDETAADEPTYQYTVDYLFLIETTRPAPTIP